MVYWSAYLGKVAGARQSEFQELENGGDMGLRVDGGVGGPLTITDTMGLGGRIVGLVGVVIGLWALLGGFRLLGLSHTNSVGWESVPLLLR